MKQVVAIFAMLMLAPAIGSASVFQDMLARLPDTDQELRLHIVETPEILGVIKWDTAGEVIFPPANTLAFHSDSLVLDNQDELRALQQQAGSGKTVTSALSPDRLFHCRSTPAICLVLDAELSGAQPEPVDSGFAYFQRALTWFYLTITLAIVGVAAFFLLLRRRPTTPSDPESFAIGAVQINPRRSTCVIDGQEQPLGARDIAILRHLHTHQGEVVSKDSLYDAAWGRDYMPNSRAIDQHMLALRRKLGDTDLIETVYGQGYSVPG